MFNINFTPEQIEEIQRAMQEETGMMSPMPQIEVPEAAVEAPAPASPIVPTPADPQQPGLLADELGPPAVDPAVPTVPGQPETVDAPAGMFDTPVEQDTPLVTSSTTDPDILKGKDLNGDGIVTEDERNSKYFSAANTDLDAFYADTDGQGKGNVFISSAGERDEQNMTAAQRFEILERANDALLGEDQEWGFEDGATGQWGTYGGPGFSQDAAKTAQIDYNRTGFGDDGIVGGPRRLGELYRQAEWTQAEVQQAQLGQVIDTPMGQYMVVNGMDGQLALKGMKGSRHGGGNYFFSMVDEGYHMGINPETGEVWFQQAPDVVDLANRVREAGGDFITAMTSGLYSGDLGVWTPERVERFMQKGSSGISRQRGGNYRGRHNNPAFTDLDWNNYGGTFMDAYKKKRDEQANRPSVMSLFKEMEDYNG